MLLVVVDKVAVQRRKRRMHTRVAFSAAETCMYDEARKIGENECPQ